MGDWNKDAWKTVKTTSDKEKEKILWEQYTTVFIKETEGNTPSAISREVPTIDRIEISQDKIRNTIQKLNKNK